MEIPHVVHECHQQPYDQQCSRIAGVGHHWDGRGDAVAHPVQRLGSVVTFLLTGLVIDMHTDSNVEEHHRRSGVVLDRKHPAFM